MKLSETLGADPDRLPYFVTDSAGNRVSVAFAPLTESDRTELSGADWFSAVYREAWIQFCGFSGTLKLVLADSYTPILGVLRPGIVTEGDFYLQDSMLETLPALRFRSGTVAPLRGVGCALVARLVVESYNQGAGGAVRVVSHPKAFGFYEHLGFIVMGNRRDYYRLPKVSAELLLEKATA